MFLHEKFKFLFIEGCIKYIKSGNKDIYHITKEFYFK